MFRRRRDDFWDWRDTVVLVTALLLFLFGLTSLALAAQSAAQSEPYTADIQRQIDRLRLDLDRLDSQFETERAETARARLDGFSRLAAAEREIQLNRTIVFGTAAGFLGQALLAGLGLRRMTRIEKAINGRANT